MDTPGRRSPSQPAVVLGLSFLAIGLSFALPIRLIPDGAGGEISKNWSPEAANVYACVAWAGWGHFIFAYLGQGRALAKPVTTAGGHRLAFMAAIACAIVVLALARWAIGPALFGGIVWVYFIDHFIKAEEYFAGHGALKSTLVRWLTSYQPLLTFGWLSLVLADVAKIGSQTWILWGVSLALAAVVLAFGGWRRLLSSDVSGPLLSLLFTAEALIWGTVGRYGGPTFLAGVYVVHIAAGSYFHYFGSYFVAASRAGAKDFWMSPAGFVTINVCVGVAGFFTAWTPGLAWLLPVLGIPWFSLWVALHLVASDIFPIAKKWGRSGSDWKLVVRILVVAGAVSAAIIALRWLTLPRIPAFEVRPKSDELTYAAGAGDLPKVKALLDKGVSPDSGSTGEEGVSALSSAAGAGEVDVVKLLLDRGANVNDEDSWGGNALTSASISGQVDTVKLLLDRGCDPNADDDGATALDYAANQIVDHTEPAPVGDYVKIVAMLRRAGGHSATLFGIPR